MNVLNRNINNIFFIFVLSHLVIWTVVPTLTNKNLPLDTIEALAWGSNLEWGFNKHPPVSAFFPELFFQIFGSQDWAYYLLSQIKCGIKATKNTSNVIKYLKSNFLSFFIKIK